MDWRGRWRHEFKGYPTGSSSLLSGALNKKVNVGLQVGIYDLKHLTRDIAKCAKWFNNRVSTDLSSVPDLFVCLI